MQASKTFCAIQPILVDFSSSFQTSIYRKKKDRCPFSNPPSSPRLPPALIAPPTNAIGSKPRRSDFRFTNQFQLFWTASPRNPPDQSLFVPTRPLFARKKTGVSLANVATRPLTGILEFHSAHEVGIRDCIVAPTRFSWPCVFLLLAKIHRLSRDEIYS